MNVRKAEQALIEAALAWYSRIGVDEACILSAHLDGSVRELRAARNADVVAPNRRRAPVVLESPYKADTAEGLSENLDYLRRCLRDSLLRGEAPFASHALYVGPLDDAIADERRAGIEAGWAWGELAERVVVYTDRGISSGMELSISRYLEAGLHIEYRTLP